jgi:hypothetical protein
MKKLVLVYSLLIMSACMKPSSPLATTGTPPATQGLPACNGANFPMLMGPSPSCSPVGNNDQSFVPEVWHVIPKTGGLAHRFLGPACTSQTVVCEQVRFYGPCGAALDPNEDPAWVGGRDAKVFLPKSGHGTGYQVNTYYEAYSNTVYGPSPGAEPYTNQIPYPPVGATCRYTLCIGPGVPGITLTLDILSPPNVPAGATLGRVRSDRPGITLSGAGKASGVFPGDVNLIAEPTGGHVRAVFSGDCEKVGEYGKRAECLVKLAPDPNITVNFECEKGFSCEGGKN